MNLLIGVVLFCIPVDNYIEILENQTGCKFIVTSGKRSVEHNRKIGGAKNSYHIYDRARDIVIKSGSCDKSYEEVADLACKLGMSVIQYTNKSHLHIDNRENPICTTLNKSY